ncbi:hypothetical protein GF352_00120, partial [archaeon]|nr:hypothetical protein [archaeon]
MNLCINYNYLSNTKLALNSYELYQEGRSNILGQIGLPLNDYTNNKGVKIFEPFLKALTDRLTSLQSLYHNSGLLIKGIDYSAITHPLRDRKRPPNIPQIKTFAYRANELVNKEQSLIQSFFIKSDETKLSSLEEILTDINREVVNKVIKKVPKFSIAEISDMFDYQRILLKDYCSYFSSKIFHQFYNEKQTRTVEDKKRWAPVTAGSMHLNFKKSMFCLKTGSRDYYLPNKHVFDVQELRRKGLINSRIMWDGTLNECPICNGEIIGLSPYSEAKHLYLFSEDDNITSKSVFEDSALIRGLL